MSLFNIIVASVGLAVVFGILWDHLRLRDRLDRDHRRIEAERLYVRGVCAQLNDDRQAAEALRWDTNGKLSEIETLRRETDAKLAELSRRENALYGGGHIDYAN